MIIPPPMQLKSKLAYIVICIYVLAKDNKLIKARLEGKPYSFVSLVKNCTDKFPCRATLRKKIEKIKIPKESPKRQI
jgi:hypothetical protein